MDRKVLTSWGKPQHKTARNMKQIEVYFDTDYKLTKNGHRVYTKTIENRNTRQQKEYMEKMHGGHEVVPEYFMMKLMNEHNNVKPNGHRWFEYTYWDCSNQRLVHVCFRLSK